MREYPYITAEQARYNAQHQEEKDSLLADVERCIIKNSKYGDYVLSYATESYKAAEYVRDRLEERGFKVELDSDEDRGYGLPQTIIIVDWRK